MNTYPTFVSILHVDIVQEGTYLFKVHSGIKGKYISLLKNRQERGKPLFGVDVDFSRSEIRAKVSFEKLTTDKINDATYALFARIEKMLIPEGLDERYSFVFE